MSTREENLQTEIYQRGAEQARKALAVAQEQREQKGRIEAQLKADRRAQQAPTTPVISNE
jgi:hypothetical protein